MSCIGFDPATVTGYAYRDPCDVWVSGTLDVKDTNRLSEVLCDAKNAGATCAYLEDCYLQNNVRTLKILQDIQTRIVVACEAADIPHHIIVPSEWQASYDITGERKERKLGARRVARMICGYEPKTQDECDAVCIADYGEAYERTMK
jgi:hypothetical protein